MFGTVARMVVQSGKADEFAALGDEMADNPPPGFVATYAYRSKDDPNEFWLVVMFESEDAYYANAEAPETHENFARMMGFLAREPEWHDGHVISQTVA